MRPATASLLAQTALTAGMTDGQIEQWLADLVGRGPMASGLNRRTFLKVLGMGTAGVAAAVWVPGQKTLFVPPERSVVTATASDLEALRAAFPGPFMTNWHNPVTFGAMSPRDALRSLSDQEYALVLERGRRVMAHRGLVLAEPKIPSVWDESREAERLAQFAPRKHKPRRTRR